MKGHLRVDYWQRPKCHTLLPAFSAHAASCEDGKVCICGRTTGPKDKSEPVCFPFTGAMGSALVFLSVADEFRLMLPFPFVRH